MRLALKILQESNRHIKISIGDVLIPFNTTKSKIEDSLYFWHPWHRFHVDKLRSTYMVQTVFAWVVQNVTMEIAENLHVNLSSDEAYLGLHAIDFSYPIHLALYRNSMIPVYRISGNTCNLFYSMSNEDDKNDSDLEEIKQFGFEKLFWEDNGARQTIFDDFDTTEHFQKVVEFEKTISPYMTEDSAGELVMLIEDLNPKLFNSLGAAVRVLSSASNEEEYAQAALSARRYFEQLADVLFPSRKELYNGKKVTNAEYRNRIWAYISDSLDSKEEKRNEKINSIGKELDRIIEEVNAVLHSEQGKQRIMNGLIDSAKLSILLLNLPNGKAKNPYYAFNNNIQKFYLDTIDKKNQ